MIQSLTSRVRKKFSRICRIRAVSQIADFVFPPFCPVCEGHSDTEFLCRSCWEFCTPADPKTRCFHCFSDHEGLCYQCRQKPLLLFPTAFVFEDTDPVRYLVKKRSETLIFWMIYQWARLDWEIPSLVTYLPGSRELAQMFSKEINCPMMQLKLCEGQGVERNQVILLIDFDSDMKERREAIGKLRRVFPRKGYLLSLF